MHRNFGTPTKWIAQHVFKQKLRICAIPKIICWANPAKQAIINGVKWNCERKQLKFWLMVKHSHLDSSCGIETKIFSSKHLCARIQILCHEWTNRQQSIAVMNSKSQNVPYCAVLVRVLQQKHNENDWQPCRNEWTPPKEETAVAELYTKCNCNGRKIALLVDCYL